MFFSPTLFTLKSVGVVLHIFCITSGDSDGNGLIRIKELSEASNNYGIPNDHVHILDPNGKIFVDGFVEWNITSLAEILLKRIKQPPKGIITFDEWGVSGHPNHINCFKTINLLTKRWNNTKFFALQSVPLWRKYLGFFDVYLTELLEGNKQIVYITWSGPISAYKIMTNHYKSQMRCGQTHRKKYSKRLNGTWFWNDLLYTFLPIFCNFLGWARPLYCLKK
uniref:N-acetylglucosaminylphosphatidylinositol deacetylase n=1 Tax=Meloidogyne javanica TaxID=6303 RepID=A0A915M8S3_MELJA